MDHSNQIKVLWVDDDMDLILNYQDLFLENGINVISANTISEALKFILNEEINNMILDVSFPGNDREGLVFLEQIKIINPDLKVILLTGYPKQSDRVIALEELLAADYIQKPIPIEDAETEYFFERLKGSFSGKSYSLIDFKKSKLDKLKNSLERYDLETFVDIFKSIFGSLSYSMKVQESYFHGYIQIILDVIGVDIVSEVETNLGRIDSIIKTRKFIYIMEFKLDDSMVGFNQIIEKKYYEKYLSDSRDIILVSIAFTSKNKNIKDYIHRPLK